MPWGLGVSQRRWSLAFLAVNIILEYLIVLSQTMVALHSPYVHSMQPLPVTLGAVAQNTTCWGKRSLIRPTWLHCLCAVHLNSISVIHKKRLRKKCGKGNSRTVTVILHRAKINLETRPDNASRHLACPMMTLCWHLYFQISVTDIPHARNLWNDLYATVVESTSSCWNEENAIVLRWKLLTASNSRIWEYTWSIMHLLRFVRVERTLHLECNVSHWSLLFLILTR